MQTRTTSTREPHWWSNIHDDTWQRLRDSIRRDWARDHVERNETVDAAFEETRGDLRFAGGEPRNVGVDEAFAIPDDDFEAERWEDIEPAIRYGVGAREQYPAHTTWTAGLEAELERDWHGATGEDNWDRVKAYVQRGWDSVTHH